MPGPSLTQVFGGPAIVTYRGQTFYSKSDITLDLAPELFPIVVDPYAQIDERVRAQPVKVRFQPAGEWKSLAVLFAYATINFGDLVTPVRGLLDVNLNQVNVPNHQLQSGDAGFVTNVGGALPTGLTAGVLYYVHYVSADAITFHTTRANAISGASPVAITAHSGSGTSRLVINNPLTIQTFDSSNGKLITLFNAAVTKMPDINATAQATLLEELEFEAFLVDGTAPGDANSLYSIATSPYTGDTNFNPTNILTQPIACSWGAVAPFSNFYTKNGVRISFALSLQPVDIDGYGIVSKRISDLIVTARCQPINMQEADLATALQLQGSGAAIGRSLAANGNNLNLSAAGFYARLFNAGLRGGPEIFARSKERIGEISFVANRSFVAGVPQQLFWVGTTSLS